MLVALQSNDRAGLHQRPEVSLRNCVPSDSRERRNHQKSTADFGTYRRDHRTQDSNTKPHHQGAQLRDSATTGRRTQLRQLKDSRQRRTPTTRHRRSKSTTINSIRRDSTVSLTALCPARLAIGPPSIIWGPVFKRTCFFETESLHHKVVAPAP